MRAWMREWGNGRTLCRGRGSLKAGKWGMREWGNEERHGLGRPMLPEAVSHSRIPSFPPRKLLRRILIRDQHVHDVRLERGVDRVDLARPPCHGDDAWDAAELLGRDAENELVERRLDDGALGVEEAQRDVPDGAGLHDQLDRTGWKGMPIVEHGVRVDPADADVHGVEAVEVAERRLYVRIVA